MLWIVGCRGDLQHVCACGAGRIRPARVGSSPIGLLRYDTGVVDVTVASDRVVFAIEGWDKLWSLRSRLEIPLAHITGAEANTDQVNQWWPGLKVAGTGVPGLFAAGTFYYHGELVFWDVRHPAQTIIVSLDHERYRKLIIEVKDPGAVVAQLQTPLNTLPP